MRSLWTEWHSCWNRLGAAIWGEVVWSEALSHGVPHRGQRSGRTCFLLAGLPRLRPWPWGCHGPQLRDVDERSQPKAVWLCLTAESNASFKGKKDPDKKSHLPQTHRKGFISTRSDIHVVNLLQYSPT